VRKDRKFLLFHSIHAAEDSVQLIALKARESNLSENYCEEIYHRNLSKNKILEKEKKSYLLHIAANNDK